MLYEILLSYLMSTALPVFHEDTGADKQQAKLEQSRNVALAATEAAEQQKSWPLSNLELGTAIVVTWYMESTLSLRIHAGDCKPNTWECDFGKARGPGQFHRAAVMAESWDKLVGVGLEPTRVSAVETARNLTARYYMCRRSPDPIQAMFSAYMGQGCKGDPKRSSHSGSPAKRLALYQRLLKLPRPIKDAGGLQLVGDSHVQLLGPALRELLEAQGLAVKETAVQSSTARQWGHQARRLVGSREVLFSVGTNDCMTPELRGELPRNIARIARLGNVTFLLPPKGCQELTNATNGYRAIAAPEVALRDKVHATPEGYRAWAQQVVKRITPPEVAR